MQVRVFEAKDMASGLKMVKEALGPDALILSTRTIRGGKFGVIGKPILEITAAIDDQWPEPASRTAAASRSERPRREETREPWPPVRPEPFAQRRDNPYAAVQQAQNRPMFVEPPAERSQPGEDIQNELAELRNMVKGLSNRITGLDASALRKPYVEPEFAATATGGIADPVIGYLTGFGINQETAQVVARFTRDAIDQAAGMDNADLAAVFKAAIARLFTTEQLFRQPPTRQRRISLIGPTGVGKTTTLAKIAAQHLGRFGGRIALVTIDTYRIAAVEQLKVYGEIMRLPVEVVIKPQELDLALEKFRDYDLILIDTAGRSPRNSVDLEEMAAFFRPELGIEHHLLLPATAREREIEEIIRRFGILPISNFIFSKIDECGQLGVLLNVHYKNDTPISFLTNGQRVPEDLIMPSPSAIADLIMNDQGSAYHG